MKKQSTTALILSALLLSTLAHIPSEKPQNKAHHLKHSRHHPSHLFRHHLRDNSQENCQWVCSNDERTGSLTVVVNQTSSIIGIVNNTVSVAWAIDVNAHLVAVFNGSSGAAVLVNIEDGTGVYIAGGALQEIWLRSHQSFEDYINSLTSLKLVHRRVGIPFTKSTITKAALEVVAGVLIHLSSNFAIQLRSSISTALTLLLQISTRVSTVFKNSLSGFLSLVKNTTALIRHDILWFVEFLEGLGALFSEIRGGIKLLIKRAVKLNLKAILVARTGIDVFILIVSVLIQSGIDVGEVLGGVFSSGERLLSLLVKLGGNISAGLTGLLKVVRAIIGLIRKRVSIQILIDVLIDFAANNKDRGSLKEELTAAIHALLKLGEKLNADESLDICWSFLKKLQDNNLIVNGVNLSSIILVLLKIGTISGLELIVRVLVLLTSVIKIQVSIIYLLFGLIIRLNTAIGIRLIMLLIPDIKIDTSILASASENLLHLILKGVRETVIKGILKGEWKDIPVIGTIYTALDVAVKALNDTKLQLSAIVTSSGIGQILASIVAGLIAEIKGSDEIHWDTSSEAAASTTMTAITEDVSPTTTESGESSSEWVVSWSTEVSEGSEVTEQSEVTEESQGDGGSLSSEEDHHGHHDNGHGHGHRSDNGNDDEHGHGHGKGHDDKHDHDHHHKERHNSAKGHERHHSLVNHHQSEDKHHHGQEKQYSTYKDKHHHHSEGKHHHSEEKHNFLEKLHLHEKQHKA